MIVYREQRRRIATAEVIRRIEAATGFERLIELGELEAGVADALCPEQDAALPVLCALRRGEWHNLDLPREIEVSVPEGFAYYALDPELYRMAARRFVSECHPARVAVIGIRSIGATLSRIVEEELGCETLSWTVRPRGHPFERALAIAPELARSWREWDGWFAVVDEGPGLSGSSFAAVTQFLAELGIDDSRVVLFPGWLPDGESFVSAAARDRWRKHRKYGARFEELGRFPDSRDLSAGEWRRFTGACPPVQPQHERRKYLAGDRLYKFAGYGRYGRQTFDRAERLRGWVPEPLELADGFLATRWVDGRQPTLTDEFIEQVARYLAFVRREFASGNAVQNLEELIEVNAGLSVKSCEGHPVHLDARMAPYEWLETASGWLKTDASDHHDDHFFPGPQDIAWDLAAFGIEFGGGEYLLERYVRESGDRDAVGRLPFYRLAYLAFRLGYCELAAQSLNGSGDAMRFRSECRRYRELIWRTTTADQLCA